MNMQVPVHFNDAALAYKNGDFQTAVSLFKQALQENPDHWTTRFYLAMCYTRVDKLAEAKREFMSIRDICPDAELRKKAGAALAAISFI